MSFSFFLSFFFIACYCLQITVGNITKYDSFRSFKMPYNFTCVPPGIGQPMHLLLMFS